MGRLVESHWKAHRRKVWDPAGQGMVEKTGGSHYEDRQQ
jgi:hypothetical protein